MTNCLVRHMELKLNGMKIFYREAGPQDAPVILLPHGYPCSSYDFVTTCRHWQTVGA